MAGLRERGGGGREGGKEGERDNFLATHKKSYVCSLSLSLPSSHVVFALFPRLQAYYISSSIPRPTHRAHRAQTCLECFIRTYSVRCHSSSRASGNVSRGQSPRWPCARLPDGIITCPAPCTVQSCYVRSVRHTKISMCYTLIGHVVPYVQFQQIIKSFFFFFLAW